jgi:hypothetical protein
MLLTDFKILKTILINKLVYVKTPGYTRRDNHTATAEFMMEPNKMQ